MKVFIVQGNASYHELFTEHGYKVVKELSNADLVCFTGGADVTPSMYGDKQHPQTGNNPARDRAEAVIFDHCIKNNIPMVGICRGAQFLNVMSGGRMYQHVTKHAISGEHEVVDLVTGETIYVTSTHHQMMMPSPQASILATAHLGGEREWYDNEVFQRDVSTEDIEVVHYMHTSCLCFQPHPEFKPNSRMASWFFELIAKHL